MLASALPRVLPSLQLSQLSSSFQGLWEHHAAGYRTTSTPGDGVAASSSTSAGTDADGHSLPPSNPQLVDQYTSPANMSKRQVLLAGKGAVVSQYQRFAGDTGSSEVQVALLTERIRSMADHFRSHRKDYVSMRGLVSLLNQRRQLLAYLRRSNFERYCFVLHKLGMKDVYAKQTGMDTYRTGTRLGQPTERIKRYGKR